MKMDIKEKKEHGVERKRKRDGRGRKRKKLAEWERCEEEKRR